MVFDAPTRRHLSFDPLCTALAVAGVTVPAAITPTYTMHDLEFPFDSSVTDAAAYTMMAMCIAGYNHASVDPIALQTYANVATGDFRVKVTYRAT